MHHSSTFITSVAYIVNLNWGKQNAVCMNQSCQKVKGIVYPKMKIMSLFDHPQDVSNLFEFPVSQKKIFWRMLVTKQLTVAIDFYNIFLLWKSMATVSCLVTNILQNIFFCVQQQKQTHTGLRESKWWHNLNFFGDHAQVSFSGCLCWKSRQNTSHVHNDSP